MESKKTANDIYWEEFYKKKREMKPSTFAKSVDEVLEKLFVIRPAIIDVLAGNGRDTKFFKEKGYKTFAFDKATSNKYVTKATLKSIIKTECNYGVVYSRFALHCLTEKEIEKLVDWTSSYFIAEFRIKGDEPVLFKNTKEHNRHFVDLGSLVNLLVSKGFMVLCASAGRGYAKYKNEDPLIGRIIAKKICSKK